MFTLDFKFKQTTIIDLCISNLVGSLCLTMAGTTSSLKLVKNLFIFFFISNIKAPKKKNQKYKLPKHQLLLSELMFCFTFLELTRFKNFPFNGIFFFFFQQKKKKKTNKKKKKKWKILNKNLLH